MASLTVENYLKAIYKIGGRKGGGQATTGRIATELGVSPGTVTSMLKTLSESNLASYTPYEGVQLTPAGRKLALRVLRRHRLIELFLVETLQLSWDEVHDEAEHMEHAVSDFLVDRIDAFLGHPATDPHGDPIPTADGSLRTPGGQSLVECASGAQFRLARVLDQSPEFLRYLTDAGLGLGTSGQVVANRPESGVLTIQVSGQQTTLARDVAEKLLVQPSAHAVES